MTSQPAPAAMIASVNPTEAECNALLALRRANGAMCVVDPDSMTVWQCGKPQYCNGKRRADSQIDPALLAFNR